MGIPRPKRLPHNGVDRIKPTSFTLRKPKDMPAADWVQALADMGPCQTNVPRVLVYVNTGNRDAKRLVRSMLHNTGCKVQEVIPSVGNYQTAMVITGSVEQLHSAIAHSCVTRYELVMSARVGHQAQGGGPNKVRSSGKVKPRKPSAMSLSQWDSLRSALKPHIPYTPEVSRKELTAHMVDSRKSMAVDGKIETFEQPYYVDSSVWQYNGLGI